jgi:hypothetical protein
VVEFLEALLPEVIASRPGKGRHALSQWLCVGTVSSYATKNTEAYSLYGGYMRDSDGVHRGFLRTQ